MKKKILFIQGGGEDGYEADKKLVSSLQRCLGEQYDLHYPELQSDESLPDFGWMQQINDSISKSGEKLIVVAHSLGASMLLKCLSENPVPDCIAGVFLLSTPFWSGKEDWETGLKLQENFAEKLPGKLPVFFYHSKDDEVAPFAHFDYYRSKVTQAIFHEIESGGHQFDNDLTLVANDIKSLG